MLHWIELDTDGHWINLTYVAEVYLTGEEILIVTSLPESHGTARYRVTNPQTQRRLRQYLEKGALK